MKAARRKEHRRFVLGPQWFGRAKTTALHQIVEDEHFWHLEAVKKQVWELEHAGESDMLNAQDSQGQTPLFLAAKAGRLEIVKYFMCEKAVDYKIAASDGSTPVMAAAANGHIELVAWMHSQG